MFNINLVCSYDIIFTREVPNVMMGGLRLRLPLGEDDDHDLSCTASSCGVLQTAPLHPTLLG